MVAIRSTLLVLGAAGGQVLEIVAIWFVCAIVGAMIDAGKKNSVYGGFLVGLLFGPLGVIVAACWPSQKVEVPAAEGGDRMLCPACRSYIPATATKCRYCASDITKSLTEEAGA